MIKIKMFQKESTRGGIITQLLVLLIVIVFTSAVLLLLLKTNVLQISTETPQEPILNMEFIPIQRSGFLAVKEFEFCTVIYDDYNCIFPKEFFSPGDEVHFRFVVETSTYNGDVLLIENYRIKSPTGEVMLEIDEKDNFHFDLTSKGEKELITFKDYFTLGERSDTGEYTLELVLENPLLQKKMTATKKFMVEEEFVGPVGVE